MNINEEKIYRHIGQRLRAQRRAANHKQAYLAHVLGMQRSSLANIESGRQRITLQTLFRLCAELGVEPTEMLPRLQDVTTGSPVILPATSPDALPQKTRDAFALADDLLNDQSEGGEHGQTT